MLYSAIDRVDMLSKLISICSNSWVAGVSKAETHLTSTQLYNSIYIPKVIKSLEKGRMSKIFSSLK